jgi:hypothetical protein
MVSGTFGPAQLGKNLRKKRLHSTFGGVRRPRSLYSRGEPATYRVHCETKVSQALVRFAHEDSGPLGRRTFQEMKNRESRYSSSVSSAVLGL